MTTIWQEFLTIVREEAGSRVVETWFKAISLCKWDSFAKVAYLKAPNSFVRQWIERHYMVLIQLHLGRLLHVEAPKIVFVGDEMPERAELVSHPLAQATAPVTQTAEKNLLIKKRAAISRAQANDHYSFDDFVVGSNNSLAYAAARAVVEKPGQLYNPLFIYGDSGLGKTHLLHAIGNAIRQKDSSSSVLYKTTDRFVNEFISAIRFDHVHKFQAKYQHVDVLLIDDVQFISNKEQTQEAFFHIFNLLYDSRKQIVFSGDTYPQNIEGIADRLRSRLAWGLVADIRPPLLETKVAIIKKKAEASGEPLDDDVAHYIASRQCSSIRELEGALIRVVAFASLTGQSVTLSLAERVLAHTNEVKEADIELGTVVECVKKYYLYGINELRSKKRSASLSLARHVTMFLMKRVTNKSLREIGNFLGGRNHATVVHGISRVEKCTEKSGDLKNQLMRMEQEITR